MSLTSNRSPLAGSLPTRTSKWTVAVLVSTGVFVALLDTTIVDIVLPKMMSSLEADIYGIQWVVITYFLGAAIAMTAVGWAAEKVGHRNAYIFGILLFVAMSATAGMATSLSMMLLSRFFQGIAEGIMMPVSMIILYETFSSEERGLAMGVYGISASFAPALGPALGGLLTEYFNWRWVFFINIPIGLIDVALVWMLMTNVRVEGNPERLDVVGFILVSAALSALIVFLGKGQEHGWLHSDFILSLLLIFVTFAVAALLWMAYNSHPLFPRRVTAHGPFALGMIAMMLFSVTAYGFFFLLPMYLQRIHGYTTFRSGMILLPGALFAGVATLASGYLSDRFNPKPVAAFLLVGVVAACWVFSSDPDAPQFRLYRDYIVWGFFVGGCFAPITLLALSTVEEHDIAVGSTLINMSRLIAGSIGTSYATALLSARRDTFYEALSGNFVWGAPGTEAMLGRLQAMGHTAADMFQADSSMCLTAMVKNLITLQASGYAFEATYQHLGVAAGAAILFVVLIPFTKKKLKVPLH